MNQFDICRKQTTTNTTTITSLGVLFIDTRQENVNFVDKLKNRPYSFKFSTTVEKNETEILVKAQLHYCNISMIFVSPT